MARRRRRPRGTAKFSAALRCLIRPWRALEPWIAPERPKERHSRFPAVRLADVITQRLESVILTNGLNDWQPITVHLDGRVSPRKRNTVFKGQMFAAYPRDIVFSKIDARHGAIGLVPAEIKKAILTPEFPIFTGLADRLDPNFFGLLTQTSHFVQRLASGASGTTGRKRITPVFFENLTIPLPSLVEQRALVAGHDAAMAQAKAGDAQAAAIERDAAAAFADALGLVPPPLPDRPAFVARFADLDRWGHEPVLRRAAGAEPPPPIWPLVRLGDVIADLENGWSPKCLDRPAQGDEWGVLKLGAVSFGTFNEAENKGLPAHLEPRPALEIALGEVLVSRANITRLVGVTAYVSSVRPKLMLCDKIFRFIFNVNTEIDPQFAAEVLRTPYVREQIESNVTGTSPTMKNISKPALLALTFPLPPLAVQRQLVADLTAARARSSALREGAHRTRVQARTDFEAAIWDEAAH